MGVFKLWVRNFAINFSKNLSKKKIKIDFFLKKELKNLEKNVNNFQTNEYYLECKQKIQNIYIKKVNVTGTRREESQLSSF